MQTILTVNGGSSSLKCALFQFQAGELQLLVNFKLGNILGDARFKVADASGTTLLESNPDYASIPKEERHQACLETIQQWLTQQFPDNELVAIGHRVVHGGSTFSEPVLVSDQVIEQLEEFIPLAPLHQPYNLKLIAACRNIAPDLPQVACFDTMFHAQQPKIEQNYALPRKLTEEGVHRYGFHGLSYEFIQRQLNKLETPALNTVICHLGAGASMCAVKDGKSIASSMGFTAVDGLPMGSRCGNIDPGVLLYLQRHYDMDTDALEALIYKQSGWLGVSGISSDMLELHQADRPEAEEAIDMFCYRAALEVGRLSAALQGLQQLVFTGGVGENDADVRSRILKRCEWLGIDFSPEANNDAATVISSENSKVIVRVIPTNEEAMIATHVIEITG
ncbi:MAG: acetate/propionate family kinase [Neptuniibacter sp.]